MGGVPVASRRAAGLWAGQLRAFRDQRRSPQERSAEYSGISSIRVITIACQSLNLAW